MKPYQFFGWLKGNHRLIWCILVSLILVFAVIPLFVMCIISPFFRRIKKYLCSIARDIKYNLSEVKLIVKAFNDIRNVWKGKEVRSGE